MGEQVRQAEETISNLARVPHAVVCNSGTSALHLAYLALGYGPNDAVVVPAFTYIATANAVRYAGAKVVFCDVDPQTWTLDRPVALGIINSLQRQSYGRVGVSPVHMYDTLAGTDYPNADDVVLDSAHAIGQPLPSACKIGVYSFFASKVIGCGEGGAVVTRDADLAAKMRLLRGQGAPTPGRYDHTIIGYNYRMMDLTAAVLNGQLESLDAETRRRREIIDSYRARLANKGARFQSHLSGVGSGWMFAILLPHRVPPASVAAHLASHGVETRPFFTPLPSLPPYARNDDMDRYPVAADLYARGLCLPTHTGMTLGDVHEVSDLVVDALGGCAVG